MRTEEEILEIIKIQLDEKYPLADLDDDSDEADAIMDVRIKECVKMLIEEKKRNGMTIARYDLATKRAYVEFPDGRKEYI